MSKETKFKKQAVEDYSSEGKKRDKKLSKHIDGTVITIKVVGGEKGEMAFDTANLPKRIQDILIPFGAGHKLGDSAAGRSGVDAEDAIVKVWEGLVNGEWSVRQPAETKVSIASIEKMKRALANMTLEDAAKTRELMAAMGVNL
ncbi:MAG: hypothetical protein A2X83_01265 [Desulfuromonadales bacterium GWD2_54_10]|nr:MAG: hypothetical protein A2X83_01265 [Desulfuromonadales bacterium GWD2_54_10]